MEKPRNRRRKKFQGSMKTNRKEKKISRTIRRSLRENLRNQPKKPSHCCRPRATTKQTRTERNRRKLKEIN
jgi:hypothetical protein